MKAGLILLAASILSGCTSSGPDYSPIGTGLSVIGLGIVIASVVFSTIGRWSGKDEDE